MACSGVTLNYNLVSKVSACTVPDSATFSFDTGATPTLQVGTILFSGGSCVGEASDGFYQDPNNSTVIYLIAGVTPGEITSVEYCSANWIAKFVLPIAVGPTIEIKYLSIC